MSLSISAQQTAAHILATRRLQGSSGPLLPSDCRPQSLQDALAIQAEVMGYMNDAVGAWKCGTPQADKVVVAPIYASTIHATAVVPVWSSAPQAVRVEPELAFVLGHDLPARAQPYSRDEVDAALSHAHLALELIASRYDADADQSFEDKLADGLVNQGLYLGPRITLDQARQSPALSIVWSGGGAQHVLAGVHPDRDPLLPLYWLAEHLRQQGTGLKAGQAVITGSYAGTFPCPLDKSLQFSYGDLGRFEVEFVARVPPALG